MLLVDYEYYRKIYMGSSIPSALFRKKIREATNKINFYTSNRINEQIINNDIKNTICQVAELLFEQEQLRLSINDTDKSSKEIASESLGPRSITYVNKSNLRADQILSDTELKRQIYKICYENLVHTGLMFRGGINDGNATYDYNL